VERASGYLLIPRIEIVAGCGGRGHAFGARAVRPATTSREALSTLKAARAAVDLRLRTGNEGRQTVNAGVVGYHRLRLGLRRLKLRLRTMLAMARVFAGLMLLARLVRLSFALVVARIVVARHERLLLLHRDEAGLLSEI
jgi:hypothetical protein